MKVASAYMLPQNSNICLPNAWIMVILSTESAEYPLLLLKMLFIALSMLSTTSRFPSGSFGLVEMNSGSIPSCIHSTARGQLANSNNVHKTSMKY